MAEQMQTVERHVTQSSRFADMLAEVADNIHLLTLNAQIRLIVADANGQAEQIAQGADQQRLAADQVLITLRAFVETVREMAQGSNRVAHR